MYKILLADEEGVALEALRVMINTDFSKYCDIRLAGNAQQMFDIFQKFRPDILFININMVGVRGLATIREFHVRQRNCLFVVVSYHKTADFGREGINLGIQGYMTKPLKHDKVRALLKRYFQLLDAERKKDELQKYHKEQWDEAIPLIESGLVSELFFPDTLDNNVSTYLSLLNITHPYAWVCDLKYSQITEHGTMCNPIGSMIQLNSTHTYFRKIVKAFFPTAIIGPILANHILVLVFTTDPTISEKADTMRRKRVSDMTYQLHRKLQLRFRFGLSTTYSIEEIYPAFSEAHNDI